jgi:hypothetical protein
LNADSSWLLSVSDGSGDPRRALNVLIDPWLVGWQTDYNRYFSRQRHVIPPCVGSIAELEQQLPDDQQLDAILVCHPFTDHCNEATLRTARPETRIVVHHAIMEKLITWRIFSAVLAVPVQGKGQKADDVDAIVLCHTAQTDGLPQVSVSALYVPSDRFEIVGDQLHGGTLIVISSTSTGGDSQSYYILYAPHGTYPSSLQSWINKNPDAKCLALIHGFDEIDNPWYLGTLHRPFMCRLLSFDS